MSIRMSLRKHLHRYIRSLFVAALMCSSVDRGLIARLDETIPCEWISYSYNYSATQTTPTLVFWFETEGAHAYYLDAVSVVDLNAPTIELLSNPGFENSTVNASNWIQSCETPCAREVISGSECFRTSGNCFMVTCPDENSSISFLSQPFLATIGNTYTISFMLNHQSNSSGGVMTLYIDIIWSDRWKDWILRERYFRSIEMSQVDLIRNKTLGDKQADFAISMVSKERQLRNVCYRPVNIPMRENIWSSFSRNDSKENVFFINKQREHNRCLLLLFPCSVCYFPIESILSPNHFRCFLKDCLMKFY